MSSDPGSLSSSGAASSSAATSATTTTSSAAAAMAEGLRSAIEAGQTHKVLDLLKMGVPIVVDQDGQTALHLAASAGQLEMVEALIQAGCDVGIQDFVSEKSRRFFARGQKKRVYKVLANGGQIAPFLPPRPTHFHSQSKLVLGSREGLEKWTPLDLSPDWSVKRGREGSGENLRKQQKRPTPIWSS